MASRGSLGIALSIAVAALAGPAGAESGLRLPYPRHFGAIPAATYDTDGKRVGAAELRIERVENGNVRVVSEIGFDDGARTAASALLAPIDSGGARQLLTQESRSFDERGAPLGVLRVDHRKRVASCHGVNNNGSAENVELPDRDRVSNVPLSLLFLPLVQGHREAVQFQLFACRGSPRILDFEARVATGNGADPDLVKIRYGPDLGPVFSWIAKAVIPRLAFWYDRKSPPSWMASSGPLYAKGPVVVVIRAGVPASRLGR